VNENFQFGGGADATFMSPAVLLLTILAAVAVLFFKKKYAFAAILVISFLTPFANQLYLGGVHFFAIRIVILAGMIRLLMAKMKSSSSPLNDGFSPLEKIFFLWAFFRAIVFVLLYREGGAVVAQVGFLLDACGGYLLFRHFLRDEKDVSDALQSLAVVTSVLSACMLYEYLTQNNLFSHINGVVIHPWIRDGRVRAQGVFANSITAGTFGATLVPLFFWLWKSGKARLFGAVGMASASIVAVTSMASTAVSAYVAGIVALCLWPMRKRMRSIRWGIVVVIAALALAMKAPVWYLVARIDLVGGHGWDRAYLVDQFVRHFFDWWLVGSTSNASWGSDTWDACNQFVAEGLAGGLGTLLLFIVILKRGFAAVGECRKRVEGDGPREWLFWCLGAAFFAHIIAFIGIDYFDQTRTLWFIFLAIVSGAAAPLLAAKPVEESPVAALPLTARPAPYSTLKGLSLKSSRQSRP
jgi:hypothetical protein